MPPIETIQTRKKIESLYVLKALSSFFVVAIHTNCLHKEWLDFIVAVGTPCFLAITGYLLFSNDCTRELKKCIKWAMKLFRLSLICMVVYLIFYCPIVDATFTWRTILLNIFTGDRICFPLWYLTALWEALLLFWLIRKYIPRLISWLPLILVLTYILRLYPHLISWEFIEQYRLGLTVRNNAVITSLPFLSIGYLIHKYEDILLKHINVNVWLPVILVGLFVENQIRIAFDFPRGLFLLLSFPCIAMLMLTCVKYRDFKIPFLCTIGEHHSANIYYYHMFVIAILRYQLNITSSYETIITWLICIPVSIAIRFLISSICSLGIKLHKNIIVNSKAPLVDFKSRDTEK